MNIRSFTFGAIALASFTILTVPNKIQAQPLNDRVDVNLPYSVTIGDKILQPGSYTIQELDSTAGKSPVLVIYGDNGMRFETSAMTIPTVENRTQSETRVILHHIGNAYYFDKIWIQGDTYGYEFVLPNNVKQRENEAAEPVSVAANASSTSAVAAPAPPVPAPQPAPAADTPAPQPAPTPEPAPAAAAVQPEPTPDNTANREMTEPAPAPATTPAPELTPAPATDQATNETPAMPHTDAGWLMMLLSGGTLTGAGAMLRRKR